MYRTIFVIKNIGGFGLLVKSICMPRYGEEESTRWLFAMGKVFKLIEI